MKLAVVLLAAGQSRRFGGIKQLASVGGQPMICHSLRAYEKLAADKVVLVLGANRDKIAPVLPDWVELLDVEDWRLGMGTSLARAVQSLDNGLTHVLVGLADQIAVGRQHIQSLIQASRQHPHSIIAAAYGQDVGVPAIFCRADFTALGQLQGDRGAKSLLRAQRHRLVPVPMPQAGFDIDTPEQLQAWLYQSD
ncbi:nucleotidyltransferase family protein [Bowmanella dokdonensis]|uniref:Nucleotidyltransferase family protein n=1 Tax=Bowmanella dokdonensis TaxID=751969 RepID=A0A939DQD2_9ALTE|nr:nucleotidyltransferase family protein [Bowmanella dokdonensis]MBN7826824.1 nucleotidyltransferase family protein [Bowmanella dokdonensis]